MPVAKVLQLASLQFIFFLTVTDYTGMGGKCYWTVYQCIFANCVICWAPLKPSPCLCLCSDPELNMCNRMSFDRLKDKLPCPVFTVLPALSKTTSGTKLWCSTLCGRIREWVIQQWWFVDSQLFSHVPPKKGLVTLAKFFICMLRDVQDSASNKLCPVER